MNTPPPPDASPRTVRGTAAAIVAVLCLLLTGCSGSDGDDSGGKGGARMKVALVTHGAPGDVYWDLVQKGAQAAAAKDGIDLTYASDSDPAGQAKLVREAIRDKTDGIAVTLAKPEAMKGPIAEAKAAGIPVVSLNSGIDAWKATGALAYFGQDDGLAGRAVGERLNGLKAKHTLCVIHERGNVGLEARCAGLKKTFTGRTQMLYADGTDMDAVTDSIAASLRQDPSIDQVVTLGAQYALAAVKAVKQTRGTVHVATFDLNKDLVAAIRQGKVQFAVDQQPYLQGYLAVDALWLHRTNGNVSGGGVAPVLTGPAFVTGKNVAAVAKYAANGTR
ncbi:MULTISPECIES: substrate-binding domain-containing protein [Streptomyces]|jgi:simple sugar transport system substrate-binding protein|uniref:Substrate-binding domain-containing protein n=1 Tax=Streptomyces thermogriseus TaxID=75292 RepID=A0ABN1SWT9_9ACTN|nr:MULTISPECIES: substrate-binding domain-containing protein [Streptomyces]MDN5385573.1 substrate-binding domain-containing protein [Streptomyces sp. LB8]